MRRVITLGIAALFILVALGAGAGPAAATNDSYFSRQWALDRIGAPQAWTVTRGAGVLIGVIDSGVDAGHPDLSGRIAGNADCAGRACLENAGGADPRGHGTSVSGVAVANADNNLGVAGVAPDARVLVAKVLGPTGEATVADVDAGIRWAVSRGARVINISLGDANFSSSTALRDSVEFAWSKGVVPVLASGNFGSTSQNYGSLNALVVGAADRNGSVASYSSPVGTAKWGLIAPGGSGAGSADDNIISTAVGGGYSSSAGTSMAAPHVSATIALLLAQGHSPAVAVNRLLSTLDRVSCGTGCQGRLNAAAAVGASAAPVTSQVPETSVPAAAPPATEAPVTTVKAKRAVRAASPVTTVAPAPPTTTPPLTTPPPVDLVAAPVAISPPTPVSIGGGLARSGADDLADPEAANRKAAMAAVAMVLALVAAAGTASVGSRMRA